MRLWHYKLLPYLPDAQFKGQLRELVLIGKDLLKNGKTNHLLINKVMEYSEQELSRYFFKYSEEYKRRYDKEPKIEVYVLFGTLSGYTTKTPCFDGWHNKEYLRVCMANLYEKHFFGVGKSRITDEEWETLCRGYKEITGEEYVI